MSGGGLLITGPQPTELSARPARSGLSGCKPHTVLIVTHAIIPDRAVLGGGRGKDAADGVLGKARGGADIAPGDGSLERSGALQHERTGRVLGIRAGEVN